jgi:GDPmannose 4,6-dehydratase
MQQDQADDFVLATGEMHSVREFVEKSFAHVGITILWQGKDIAEVGLCSESGAVVVRVDRKSAASHAPRTDRADQRLVPAQYFRPAEVEQLLGNPAKAQKILGWKRHVSFDELVKDMVESDVIG